jgi:hypothetical protein
MISLPACVRTNTAFSQSIKTAIVEGNISSRDEFVQEFKELNLPEASVSMLSKLFDQECRSELELDRQITSGLQDAQTSQRHVSSSVQVSNVGAASASEGTEANDHNMEFLKGEDQLLVSKSMCLQVSYHDSPAQSAEDTCASIIHSHSDSGALMGAQNLMVLYSGSAKSAQTDKEFSEEELAAVGSEGITQQSSKSARGPLDAGQEQISNEIPSAIPTAKGMLSDAVSDSPTTSVDLQKLFAAVNMLFLDFSANLEGVSGTMTPRAKVQILSEIDQAFKAGMKSKCEQGKIEYDFVDLGCSSGHTLACAAISGFFEEFYGADLPSNADTCSNHFKIFMNKIRDPKSLSKHEDQLQKIQMHWANADNRSKKNITQFLGLGSINLRWLFTGFMLVGIGKIFRMPLGFYQTLHRCSALLQ